MLPEPADATRILARARTGDADAAQELFALLYAELRALAGRLMEGERAEHTLQPTALVHEAWMRLADAGAPTAAEDRRHFVRLAARAMRHTLVDHARARGREKRGGGREAAALDRVLEHVAGPERLEVPELSDALERLAGFDETGARVVELRFFAGLSIAETADVLGLSTATVERTWRVARLWLSRELAPDAEA